MRAHWDGTDLRQTDKSYDLQAYDPDAFDHHFCLKIPTLLAASIVFLCRDFLTPVLLAVTSLGGGANNLDWLSATQQPLWYLREMPSVGVFYAMLRRAPTGDAVARWAWRHGRGLLALAVALQSAPTMLALLAPASGHLPPGWPAVCLLALDLFVLCYVLLSGRVRDVFSDFPAPTDAPARKST